LEYLFHPRLGGPHGSRRSRQVQQEHLPRPGRPRARHQGTVAGQLPEASVPTRHRGGPGREAGRLKGMATQWHVDGRRRTAEARSSRGRHGRAGAGRAVPGRAVPGRPVPGRPAEV
jgi:hypothetical protein